MVVYIYIYIYISEVGGSEHFSVPQAGNRCFVFVFALRACVRACVRSCVHDSDWG